jgi:hypothetical protein
LCLGFGPSASIRLASWISLAETACNTPDPETLAMKKFKPKFDLPVLENYKVIAPPEFWNDFPNRESTKTKLLVCPDKLINLAEKCFLDADPDLPKICKDLRHGADIGCKGPARLPSSSTNAPSAFQYVPEVTDAVADWIKQGFAA